MIEPTFSTATPAPEEDVTTALYRAAVGPIHEDYYLPIFTRFEAAGRAGISWNTAACLCTLNWLVFRQLWIAALAYAAIIVTLFLLVFGIGWVVFELSDALIMALALGFGLAAFVLPGLFGNALLHRECRRRMAKALAAHSVVAEACADLLRQASTRKRTLWLAGANAAVLLAAVLAYLQFSAVGSVAVMPQGALDAGHVAVGDTVKLPPPKSLPISGAPTAPAPEMTPPASMPQAPVATPSAPPAAPVSAPTAVAPSAAAVAAPLEKASAPGASASKPPAKAAAKRAAASTNASADTADKPFFINVGLFAKPENAANAHAKLLDAQLPSVTKALKSSRGPLTRVRVGPFASRSEAQAAAEKIKALQLDAMIIQP